MASVTLANIRLSLVAGAAFVDFSAAGTLTPYLNYKLTITDSAGKKASGYIKAAGTGETLGAEQFSTTDFTTGWTLASGTHWSAAAGVATHDGNNLALDYVAFTRTGILGGLYKTTVDVVTATSGSLKIYDNSYTEYSGEISTTGTKTYYSVRSSSSAKGAGFISDGTSFNGSIQTPSRKQVLTPSATGVTITSTAGGSTYNWTSIESGFNYNDAGGYTFYFMPSTGIYKRRMRRTGRR